MSAEHPQTPLVRALLVKELRGKLKRAETALRAAQRLLNEAGEWQVDEDELDALRRLRGLIALLDECYRSGRGLDEWAVALWLYENGYEGPAA